MKHLRRILEGLAVGAVMYMAAIGLYVIFGVFSCG